MLTDHPATKKTEYPLKMTPEGEVEMFGFNKWATT